MDDPAFVGRVQRVGDLFDDRERAPGRQRRVRSDQLRQRLALEQLHHQVGDTVVGHVVVDHPDDVRMAEGRGDLRFLAKSGQGFLVACERPMQQLDGEFPGQPRVRRQVDLPEAALGERPDDAVGVLQHGPDGESVHRRWKRDQGAWL